ncbi:iron-containing redox enzyme family protein [Streptomyces katrae]|uniref:iron-containing redox enzyme family protein n=1 Tax=Streptomyces katrae TaxID=68223 RepID=UPI00131B5085|nr:iron-containing redox enzyme family protein [Streptomyces katrae]
MALTGPWNAELASRLVESNFVQWQYGARFLPTASVPLHPAVEEASRLVPESGVERHPFFALAGASRPALEFWVTQELFVTGVFAQLLGLTSSALVNVHQRARFNLVLQGEHGGVKDGVARASHPWLLHKLAHSMGIVPDSVTPAEPTYEFLRDLASSMSSPISALGALGVGNEQMLVPEYGAVKSAFENAAPDVDHGDFLNANIYEDTEHSALIAHIASELIAHDPSLAEDYLTAARSSVTARMRYYDRLADLFT